MTPEMLRRLVEEHPNTWMEMLEKYLQLLPQLASQQKAAGQAGIRVEWNCTGLESWDVAFLLEVLSSQDWVCEDLGINEEQHHFVMVYPSW